MLLFTFFFSFSFFSKCNWPSYIATIIVFSFILIYLVTLFFIDTTLCAFYCPMTMNMKPLDKTVLLLSRTTGRDKIYKFMGGMFDVLAAIAKRSNNPHYKAYASISPAIVSGRSLLRLGKFMAEIPRMTALISIIRAQGFLVTEWKHFLGVLRCILNCLWIFGDNIAFLAKYGVIRGDPVDLWEFGKTCQFWGFSVCALLDLIDLRDAIRRFEYDPRWSHNAAFTATLDLLAHISDILETMAQVGYCSEWWNPSSGLCGVLTCFSATMSTASNWRNADKI